MNDFELYQKTFDAVDTFKETVTYLQVQSILKQMEQDQELKELIHRFNGLKEKYLSAKPMKDFYPDFDKLTNDFIEVKTKLYNNKLYKSYINALAILNTHLNEITNAFNVILEAAYIDPKKTCKKV